ncbi:FtsK/SpoIIIE domain-containing protein [Rubripirellula amarantea]|nr:FtsK/SpoIIIE domain-containing protein [Rubripirellula amarantea]
MKDSTVSPTGLMNVTRSKQVLSALADRVGHCVLERERLKAQHAQARAKEEIELNEEKRSVTSHCRDSRRNMLNKWDNAEEILTFKYEQQTLSLRSELNRLAVIYRRKKQEEEQTIERKVEARHQAVLQQFENRKNQPGQQQRKEIKQIDEALLPLQDHLEWANALTVRRLDGLLEVGPPEDPEEDMSQPLPKDVREAIDTIDVITRKCNKVIHEMQTGAASKIVDSFYLPAGVGAFVLMWGIIAIATVEKQPYLWAAAGVIPAGILGFTIYLILLMPLKRMTRKLYPRVVRLGRAADECAEHARKISRRIASDSSTELIERRDAHIAAAKRWKTEQLAELEKRINDEFTAKRAKLLELLEASGHQYEKSVSQVTEQMRENADQVAQAITNTLAKADHAIEQKREANSAKRFLELQYLTQRLATGVKFAVARIEKTNQAVRQQFPSWKEVLASDLCHRDHLDCLPLGSLLIGDELVGALNVEPPQHQNGHFESATIPIAIATENPANASPVSLVSEINIPDRLPIVLHRRLHSCLVIHCDESTMSDAIDMCQQLLWRLLSSAPASRAKLTLIDPIGRGQNFTSLMALADHDASIIGHRVWTTDNKIETRLSEIAHYVEDVLQSSLRDRFERIEDYNLVAGSMAVPYRAITGIGLPSGLSREGYKHLNAIINSGLRCGIFTILVCRDDQPWPTDMPIPSGSNVMQVRIKEDQGVHLEVPGLEHLALEPLSSPPPNLRDSLVEKIGVATVNASRVEIPLDQVLTSVIEGSGETNSGINIPVGSQGANRTLSLDLGEGVRQHVLIAGKTGSGKSTLLHSIITAGAYQYRPDQLQFYLLDFKKGVEFKVYADSGLPHARVIGIESEREFGRSVLQRLDAELQSRGEKFRAVGAQELGAYREKSEDAMPRIMLVVDEFQELFMRDDRIAADCAMLLDRLVRQGRSFGMHVILSSQSLAGAYSLPRATLGQMAVRIAMQCSEADAALILSDDNTAARLISRPGEAIYNNAGGLAEGNQPFQVAWLSADRHREMLVSIAARDQSHRAKLGPAVIFEGNRPCYWTSELADAALQNDSANAMTGLLGESVEIGPPLGISLSRDPGRNALLVAGGESRAAILATAISGFAKSVPELEVVYFDGARPDDGPLMNDWLDQCGINLKSVKPRDSEAEIARVADIVKQREENAAGETSSDPPVLVVIDPLERFRDLRQDESFSFSLDAASEMSGGKAFQTVLREGPSQGVFVLAVCSGAETLSRWLPRGSQHDFELRILGQMNQNDSSFLVDSPVASDLSTATMLVYDHADGSITKFRQSELPDAAKVKKWLNT